MSSKGERSIEDKASTIVQKIHWTGAFLAFVGGLVWMTIQVDYKLNVTQNIQTFSRIQGNLTFDAS